MQVDTSKYRQVIIVNGELPSGPQIVFPFFRPISLYEIEDDFDNLMREIEEDNGDVEFMDQMILFMQAFKDALEEKNSDPLVYYFMINHGNEVDFNQIQDVFDVLDDFIEKATDENRPMH